MSETRRKMTPRVERPRVAELEAMLGVPIPVLDHGFVRVIDYMGDDGAIVQAARVSYGRGTKTPSADEALIRYLMRHRHTSPFEMCEIKLHVKLPIFVARQWIRHRTANVNEYSARYSILSREFYVPDPAHIAAQSETNRQGRDVHPLAPEEAEAARRLIAESAERAFVTYFTLLNEREDGETLDYSRSGIARELARVTLPLSTYTEWYWKIDLHNLFHFLALRADPHAQYEIRAYAEAIGGSVARWVPMAWRAFVDYRLDAVTLSGPAMAVLRRWLAGETVTEEESGLGRREWRELCTFFRKNIHKD